MKKNAPNEGCSHLNSYCNESKFLTIYHTSNEPAKEANIKKKKNIVGKGENAGTQHFLLFPQCFFLNQKRIFVFKLHLFCPSAYALNLDQSRNFPSCKELTVKQTDFNMS